MSNAVTHAPEVNLAMSTTMVVRPVAIAPMPLTNMRQWRPLLSLLLSLPVDDPGLAEGEGEEGADGVERDEAVGDASKHDENDGGEAREGVDARGRRANGGRAG